MADLTRQQLCAARASMRAAKRAALGTVPKGRAFGRNQAQILDGLMGHISGLQTKRWRERTIEAFEEAEDDGDFRDACESMGLLPDAFVIYKDTRELHFFEIEVTHIMSADKLQAYARFVTIMDFYEVEFGVFTVNQYGHIWQVALLPYYVDWLIAEQERAK